MKVHIITSKFLPPWDSAISSFSFNLVLGLILRGFKVLVHTSPGNISGYMKMYSYNVTYHILEDLKILRKIKNTDIIYGNTIKVLLRDLDEPILMVEPRSSVLMLCELNSNCNAIFITPRKYYCSRYYATFEPPWSPRHMPVGIPVTLLEALSDDENIRLLIDHLREQVDYVAGFIGPIISGRFSLFDVTRIIKSLEQQYRVRLGVVGFVTIRHAEDVSLVRKAIKTLNRLYNNRIILSVSAVSMRAKVTLCRYTDLLLYPIKHIIELADPPFSVLEWAACGKPSVFRSFGALSRLYPFRECMYDIYSVANVVSAIYECLHIIEDDENKYVLRKFIDKLFSLDHLTEKLEGIIKSSIGANKGLDSLEKY